MTAATARASPPPCTTPPSVRWDRLPSPSRNAPRMIAASALTLTRVVTPLTAAIILGAFLLGDGSLSHLTEGGVVQGGGLARAVAAVIWTYDGWIAVSMIAGE